MPYVQWTTPDGDTFFPSGEVVKQLPPGYYDVESSMRGVYFTKKKTKTESLIRFTDANSDKIIEEIESFWNKESKFREANVPYKRGLMMYGPPGSGKTCTIRIVIENLVKEREGIVIDWPGVSLFKEGYEVIRQIHPGIPIVCLMEDVDAIANRCNESDLLNLLDGAYNIDKVVFLASTNYPERLGSRFMNRPSRFDKKFFIGMPSQEARAQYLSTKLKDVNEVKQWAKDTDGFSIAHLKELFVASKILGDDYNGALKTLRKMKSQSGSAEFDNYGTGRPYAEAKKKFGEPMSESVQAILAGKLGKRVTQLMSESVANTKPLVQIKPAKKSDGLTPKDIAGMMSEDIRTHNGLLLE